MVGARGSLTNSDQSLRQWRDLEKAYEALEAAVDIWEAIDQELPSEGMPLAHP